MREGDYKSEDKRNERLALEEARAKRDAEKKNH